MERIASVVAVRKNERLLALTLDPLIRKSRRVPIDFVEYVRSVNPTWWAVRLSTCQARAAGEHHVLLVVVQPRCGVIATREMNVGAKRRVETIAVLIGESNASTSVIWVLDPYTVGACAANRIERLRCGGTGTGPLHRLRGALGSVEDRGTSSGGRSACIDVANDHAVAWLECHNLIVGGLEAIQMSVSYISVWNSKNALQVVNVHVVHVDVCEFPSNWVLEVESGGPVGALIVLDQCGGAGGTQ